MGYTHYWRQENPIDADLFAAFTRDVALILETADEAGIPLGNAMGQGKPEVTETCIALNGFDKFGYESFVYDRKDNWSFCKTGQRPYDCVVTAILIAAKRGFGNLVKVTSDGDWSDWTEGRNLYAETFGVEAKESEVFDV